MTEEDEEFNRIERESAMRKAAVKATVGVALDCPTCERYKQSAAMWRNKAYELGGTPLPWKADELWVGLTDADIKAILDNDFGGSRADCMRAAEAKLKEKNT